MLLPLGTSWCQVNIKNKPAEGIFFKVSLKPYLRGPLILIQKGKYRRFDSFRLRAVGTRIGPDKKKQLIKMNEPLKSPEIRPLLIELWFMKWKKKKKKKVILFSYLGELPAK